MSKAVKAMVVAELKARYAEVDGACIVDLTGLNVPEQEKLRRSLSEKSARLEVVKNSMTRRALRGCPLEPLGEALEGPCAFVTTAESLVDAAKVLVEAAKEFDKLKLKQAIIEGDPNLLTVEDVSKMKSLSEMQGEVAMLIASPGRAVAGCVGSAQSRIAGCLKAIVDKAA